MRQRQLFRWSLVALAVILPVLITPSGALATPTVIGQASAVQATVFGLLGSTTTIASTGSLVDDTDARAVSELAGSIPSIGGVEVPTAFTISSINGWNPSDDISSAASLGNVVLSVAGNQITASFVMSEATALVDGTTAGSSTVEGLAVNGVPITPDGAANQTILLPGLTLVLNEVQQSAGSITVNALHITSLDGLVNLVIASATAGIGQ